jgi:hypothetical protein
MAVLYVFSYLFFLCSQIPTSVIFLDVFVFYLPFLSCKFFSCYPGSVLRQLMLNEADFPEGTVDDQ